MYCTNCGNAIDSIAKFCGKCGMIIDRSKLTTQHDKSIDQTKYAGQAACQTCGSYAPLKYVEFYQNIGMLIRREQKSIKGKLCKKCINKYFTSFTLTTLLFGWWGTISFFVTLAFLANNTFRYISSLSLKHP